MAILIRTDGRELPIGTISLQKLQHAVGGLIEAIDIGHGKVLICNEEGKLQGLEPNWHATSLLLKAGGMITDIVVGNAVVCFADEME